jgi:hypothetical protein
VSRSDGGHADEVISRPSRHAAAVASSCPRDSSSCSSRVSRPSAYAVLSNVASSSAARASALMQLCVVGHLVNLALRARVFVGRPSRGRGLSQNGNLHRRILKWATAHWKPEVRAEQGLAEFHVLAQDRPR